MLVTLELPEPPSANRWWRKYRNRMVLSSVARAYKEAVAMLASPYRIGTGPAFPTGPIIVRVRWDRAWKAGDLDKRLGILLDALQGTVYQDDAQVQAIHAERVDLGTGTVYVTVRAA